MIIVVVSAFLASGFKQNKGQI
ncbi:unnamed protein product, partial [Vitis vinifera]|uniref:Uncharacterized protein n=1 Tax=Vitis vinifera TaxID=29760 RepID=D7SQ22_VITVI